MGGGSYSISNRVHNLTATYGDADYYKKAPVREIFHERSMNNAMDPKDVDIRESRDSAEHPNSLAIILALDVTGSMGSIPHFLVKTGLPEIMDGIIQKGVKDPQLLFLGVGDHTCDRAPLQVGQFESSDELLDHWLTNVYLEGGGGGNDGESYLLAWYFAGKHTSIDCFEKRGKKGFLFTIGDEPCLDSIPKTSIKALMGKGQFENFDATDLLDKAREKYEVFHIHMKQGSNGSRQEVIDGWTQLVGKDNLIVANKKEDVSGIIKKIVTKGAKVKDPTDVVKPTKEDIIL